jgi:hypothetical protein
VCVGAEVGDADGAALGVEVGDADGAFVSPIFVGDGVGDGVTTNDTAGATSSCGISNPDTTVMFAASISVANAATSPSSEDVSFDPLEELVLKLSTASTACA